MLKEEIMDIDESPPSDQPVQKTPQIKQEIGSYQPSLKSADFKYKLLERLENSDASLTKNLTLAITIQTMFNADLEVLERLFRFFIERKQLDMAVDLWENDLLKRFNLAIATAFDEHLQRIATQIIYHLSVKKLSDREKKQLIKIDTKYDILLKILVKG